MAITIKNGARVLYRWERGVALTVTKPCDILRLYREDDRVGVERTPTWSGSTGSVTIPDRMLTESGYLHAARVEKADGEERIIETARFLVRDAQKPGNHVASTKEVRDWETLKLQMEALERAAREGEFDGADGITPHVGENGNWFIGDVDTGVHAQGDPGDTPYIGENGYWYIGETDTGVRAKGENGITPHIGANGNWFIGEYDTGVHAQGDPGITPHIGENGNWFIGEYDTGVLARNEDVSFYADDLLTSGILGEGAMSLEILAPEGSNVIRYRIDSAVVYVKGVRRARGAFSVNRQAVGHERLIANVLRYNEAKGSFSWTLGEVVRDGDVFVNVDNGEIYPTRSDGYYDLVPYLVHIPAGATSITTEQVEDLRADERYCGYVRSRFAPTKVSELENDSGYVTGDQIENVITTEPQELTDEEKAQARANIGAAAAGEGGSIDKITSDMVVDALGYTPAEQEDIPTKVSELENDEGFITRLVSDLANYYDKSEVNSRLSQIPRFSIRVVSALPTTYISETTVYLVKSGSGPDLYTEYIHVGGIWEILGSQRVDLTGYATEDYVIAYVTADRIKQVLGYTPANASDLEKVRERAEVKPDLAQNDENADDYVKGRTHWREKVARVVVPAREKGTHYIPVTDGTKDLAAGKTYTVIAGGTEYSSTAYKGMVSELLYLGDSRLYDGLGNLNTSAHPENVPFLLEVFVSSMVGDDSTETDLTVWHSMADERATVSVIEPGVYDDGYRHIDDGYLPDSAARTDSAVMHDRTQNLDEGHKRLARKNIGALAEDELPTAIDSALEQAKASGDFKGDPGAPGTDGVSPTVTVSKSGDITTLSVTDKNGTQTVTILDGEDCSDSGGGIDPDVMSELYTSGVIVNDYPDAQSILLNGFNTNTEKLSIIIKYGSVIVNGVAKYFDSKEHELYLPSTKDNRVAFGYRLNITTGEIEEKVWTDYTVLVTGPDGIPTLLMVGTETIPLRFTKNYYDIIIGLIEKPKGTSSFTASMITDTRGVKALCGYVESKLCKGGDGADIDVTAEAGQTIVVKEVDANGKPTKWEAADYQPRTHWTAGTVELIPETVGVMMEGDEQTFSFFDADGETPLDAEIVAGQGYEVVYNGAPYHCDAVGYEGVVFLGNIGLMTGGTQTGEPFIIARIPADDGTYVVLLVSLDGATSVTLALSGEVIEKLPSKYIDRNYVQSVVEESVLVVNLNWSGNFDGFEEFSMPLGDICAAAESGKKVVIYAKRTNGNYYIEMYEFTGTMYNKCLFTQTQMIGLSEDSSYGISNKTILMDETKVLLVEKDYNLDNLAPKTEVPNAAVVNESNELVVQRENEYGVKKELFRVGLPTGLDESDLQGAVEDALAQAKASGEFDGADGKTPVKGTDYYTEADKTEMVSQVIAALPTWTGGSY